ncbi:MAG: hypothetical protein IPH45_15105 [Bacteroidales bacterium]|nr:hypothetical protein [Bacteroidales bacterium]
MNRKTLVSRITAIVLFALVLCSAFLQQAFHWLPEMPNSENRRLSDKPVLRLNLLDPFPVAYEAYYNDHFAYRNQLVKVYSDLSLNLFNKCPYPDQVILGKKGNLFMVPKELVNYQRTDLFTREDLDKVKSDFLFRKKYLAEKGIDYYFAICPTKYSIYPEYLPWFVQQKDTISRTDQFIGLLKSIGIKVIDLRPALLAAKDSIPEGLFMATDNHWNDIGGFVGYQEIMKNIRHNFPGLKMKQSSDYNIQTMWRDGGNLAVILNKAKEMRDRRYFFNPKYKVTTSLIQPCPYQVPEEFEAKEYFKGYTQSDASLPNILIIHDSFGQYVQSYFKDSFSRTVFIWDKWQYKLNESILEQEKPDIYVTLCLESLLKGLADNCEFKTISGEKQ